MKIIASIIIFLISQYSYPQDFNKKNLKYYSYILSGFNNNDPNTNGTGFIIKYKEINYLVSNYHVFTGKKINGEIATKTKKENTSLFVIFKPKDSSQSIFYPMRYELYNRYGEKKFSTFRSTIDGGLIDVAVMPIIIPDEAYNCAIDINTAETSIEIKKGTKLVIVGFPHGDVINNWEPTYFYTRLNKSYLKTDSSVTALKYNNPLLTFGTSGSPVYIEKNDSLRLISINTLMLPKENKKDLCEATPIEFALIIIRTLYERKIAPFTGKYQKGR
ncbi:MAG: hypothetical protein ABUT20_63465 [Bacteroidota bacterium]